MKTHDREATSSHWGDFVLIPAEDVPQSGSRTEIVVTPSRCLRVRARIGPDGDLILRPETREDSR